MGTGESGVACFYSAQRLAKVKYVYSKSLRSRFIYRYCHATVTDNYEMILNDNEIRSVIVCNSSNQHFEFAKKALSMKKNVLIEKPICLNLNECDELESVASENKVRIGGILQYRFLKVLNEVKQLIDSGILGEIIFITGKVYYRRNNEYFSYGRGTKENDGGGVLIKQAIHCLDCLAYLGNGLVSAKSILTNFRENIDVEDTAVAVLKFTNGSGSLLATISSFKEEPFVIEVIGTKGKVSFSQKNRILFSEGNFSMQRYFMPQDLMYGQVKDFLESLEHNRPMKINYSVAKEALKNIELLYAGV